MWSGHLSILTGCFLRELLLKEREGTQYRLYGMFSGVFPDKIKPHVQFDRKLLYNIGIYHTSKYFPRLIFE